MEKELEEYFRDWVPKRPVASRMKDGWGEASFVDRIPGRGSSSLYTFSSNLTYSRVGCQLFLGVSRVITEASRSPPPPPMKTPAGLFLRWPLD